MRSQSMQDISNGCLTCWAVTGIDCAMLSWLITTRSPVTVELDPAPSPHLCRNIAAHSVTHTHDIYDIHWRG